MINLLCPIINRSPCHRGVAECAVQIRPMEGLFERSVR